MIYNFCFMKNADHFVEFIIQGLARKYQDGQYEDNSYMSGYITDKLQVKLLPPELYKRNSSKG